MPEFCGESGNPDQPYTLVSTSPCAQENNPGCGQIGALPVGCLPPPRTWHVPLDAPTIQAGIDSAAVGDTVMVACGTYLEHDVTLKTGIVLTSETGQADCVTVDAQASGYVFLCHEGGETAEIVGFTATGGRANFGPGLICTADTYNITNCLFLGNEGLSQGGGMQFEDCSPTVTNCTVVENTGPVAGGIATYRSDPVLERTIIAYNTGRSLSCPSSSTITLTCCDIFANSEGDWIDCFADQLGVNGNAGMPPGFCGEELNPDQPYSLLSSAYCAPGHNPGCGLIGALPVGCVDIAVEVTTWGRIKAGFAK